MKKNTIISVGLWNAVMLLSVSLLKEIRVLKPFGMIFQILLIVGIGMGALIIAFNIWTKEKKTVFDVLSFGLVATLALSSLLSPGWRGSSLKEAAVSGICVLSIFPLINGLTVEKKRQWGFSLLKILLATISMISLISIVLFFIKPYISFNLLGYEIEIGTSTNRLFGLYQSLTLPISASALVLAGIFRFSPQYSHSKPDSFIFYGTICINFIFNTLSFSYGILISLAATTLYVLFFVMLRAKKHFLLAFLIGCFGAVALMGAVYVTRVAIFKVVSIDGAGGSIVDPDEPELPADIEKQQYYGILTGRDLIWKFGIEELADRPIIGFGATAFYGTKVLGTQELQHFHNVFVQSLVGGGILHSLFSFSVIGIIVVRCFKYSFKKVMSEEYLYNLSIIAFLVFSVVGGFVETNFLYVNRFPQYIFWIVLGLLTFDVSKSSRRENMLNHT